MLFRSQILAALGADVVKVERPDNGDDGRAWGPPFWNGESVMFLSANAGKRSLALSLRDPRGRDALLRLADDADVFLQSLRPGLAEELGLGPSDLRSRNPRLVYCSLGAYGSRGPLRTEPGYDALMQAAGGLILRVGRDLPDDYGPPRIRPSLPGSDFFVPTGAFGWYLFAGVEERAVARNIFLDGNTFAHSRSVDKNTWVGDFQYGIAVTVGATRIALTEINRTREFEGQQHPDSFGALTVGFRF